MTINVQKYVRKPFSADAVQVTEENMEEVAEWCMGDIQTTPGGTKFIRVRVHHPQTERQKRAFPGDWVLYAHKGYKIYTPKAFEKTFQPENRAEVGT